MPSFNAICLFCEDIREEKSGQDTIVGTMPDTVFVAGPPPPNGATLGQIARLACYLRIQFATTGAKPDQLVGRMENYDGIVLAYGEWPADIISKAFSEAANNDHPFVGFVLKLAIGPVTLKIPADRLRIKLMVDGVDHTVGEISFKFPSASAPPS